MKVVFLWLCVCAAVPVQQEDTELLLQASRSSAWDDEIIGGVGIVEPPVVVGLPQSPQAYSLIQEDEGGDVAEDDDDLPEVEDPSMEVQSAKGVAGVMKSSGLGHMIGKNDKITKVNRDPVLRESKDLEDQLHFEEARVAELKGLIELSQKEHDEISKKIADRQATQEQLLSETKKAFDERIAALKQEHEEHIASVKREAAMRVKRIRNQMERDFEAKHSERERELEGRRESVTSRVKELQENIALEKKRIADANKHAEEIYAKNRAEWKVKREHEMAAKGVQGQIADAVKEIDAQKSRVAEIKDREGNLKQHIKELEKEKILMAARLKNLHNREEALKEVEQKFNIENEHLRHQIEELAMTQKETEKEAERTKQEGDQTVILASTEAKAKAKEEVQNFEKKTLAAARDEIASLKEQMNIQLRHQERAERDILQQEHNIQAEQKEAADAMDKALQHQRDAEEQIKTALVDADAVARKIVDDGRRRGAAIKEQARSSGFSEGVLEAQGLLQKEAKETEMHSLKEAQIKAMVADFKEKMDTQIRNHELSLKANAEKERAEMEAEVSHSINSAVLAEKDKLDAAIRNRQEEVRKERARAASEEKEISTLEKENGELQAEIDRIHDQLKTQKQEWDRQLIDAPVY